MRVLIVGGGYDYLRMFTGRGWELTDSLINADLVQFTGGADVTPEIYGEKNTRSHNSLDRDLREAGYFALALRMGIPMAGICRGGQFLNVMCGGKMIQHVEGHGIHGTHTTAAGKNVTSTHHQAMLPGDFCSIIDWCPKDKINEVLYYLELDVLCFQPHPEFQGYDECQDYYFELLNRCLGLKV